jgi:hypothetical protein
LFAKIKRAWHVSIFFRGISDRFRLSPDSGKFGKRIIQTLTLQTLTLNPQTPNPFPRICKRVPHSLEVVSPPDLVRTPSMLG